MKKCRVSTANSYTDSHGGGRSKPSFWLPKPGIAAPSAEFNETGREGVLALELVLQKPRLEPITGKKSPEKDSHVHGAKTSVGSPSTHWRGICTELPASATPVHHLFSVPASCLAQARTPAVTESLKPGTAEHPARPVSCPTSLCSSAQDPPDNTSHTEFRGFLAAVKCSLQLPHLHQTPHVPFKQDVIAVAQSGHVKSDSTTIDTETEACLNSFPHMRTDHELLSRWATGVDLCHGAQGVVSRLCGQMHGPGPHLRSMPVQDLTVQVPIRKGQDNQSNFQVSQERLAYISARKVSRSHGSCREPRPCTQPSRLARGTQLGTMLAHAPLQSLMTAVHEVSEVLHVLGKYHRALSQALFDRLISWSSDMATSANLVAEVDFTVPKAIMEKAQQVLSSRREDIKESTDVSPRNAPTSCIPERPRSLKGSHCSTRDRVAGRLRSLSPSQQRPTTTENWIPSLKVRSLSKPTDYRATTSVPASQPAPHVTILHEHALESDFEVQGVQLLEEQLWGGHCRDVNLRGLAWNHAHTYLSPRHIPTPAGTPVFRRDRLPKAAASVVTSHCSGGASCAVEENASPRKFDKSQPQKQVRMFGWDRTDRIPAVSAFYEGGVQPFEALIPSCTDTLDTVAPEIWDYVGQT